ncbi:hypothetical protein BKA56DRAFT_681514 [Ilyonectria sp. MPI-CAGE-AT-0026]|nr:hypothetical protein BKA56DRAFT_681514 [Ilyonectria sp. MPI-CAGE-AT-0026]
MAQEQTRGAIAAFTGKASHCPYSTEHLINWYDNIHIKDVISTSGMRTAYRFSSLNPSNQTPWLVFYPVNDIAFFSTDEFRSIPTGSDKHLGGRQFLDLANGELRILKRLGVWESEKPKIGVANLIVVESIKPKADSNAEFQQWYTTEYLDMIKKIPGFRRTSLFHLEASIRRDGAPTFTIFHEFDLDEEPTELLRMARESSSSKQHLSQAEIVEYDSLELKLQKGVFDSL